jgi:glycosyltransferase involved in cell wall biosynthesis
LKDFILIIPYLNNKEGLLKSLNSVHYKPDLFGVIVVDDGSSPPLSLNDLKTPELNAYRIQILRSDTNQGVAKALNLALGYLEGKKDFKYIARLDCGDICINKRFEKQVLYLDSHPGVALIGSPVKFKNYKKGTEYLYETETSHTGIEREMHFRCSFIHPAVMFRREIMEVLGKYPENYEHCEDYAYFFQIIKKYESANLAEVLLITELNEGGVSARNRTRQLVSRMRVVNDFGTSTVLKMAGLLKLCILLLIPRGAIKLLNRLNK